VREIDVVSEPAPMFVMQVVKTSARLILLGLSEFILSSLLRNEGVVGCFFSSCE